MFLVNSVESITDKKCFQCFLHFFNLFPSLLLDCAVFQQVTLRFGLFTESQEEWNFQNFGYFGIIADSQFYTLQLVYSLLK